MRRGHPPHHEHPCLWSRRAVMLHELSLPITKPLWGLDDDAVVKPQEAMRFELRFFRHVPRSGLRDSNPHFPESGNPTLDQARKRKPPTGEGTCRGLVCRHREGGEPGRHPVRDEQNYHEARQRQALFERPKATAERLFFAPANPPHMSKSRPPAPPPSAPREDAPTVM